MGLSKCMRFCTQVTTKNPTMTVKLDMVKAYDRVSWKFLNKVLESFGFGKRWRTWIDECVSTPMFSILVNGEAASYFKSSRGLRQGDPLSPFFFVILAKGLGKMIKQARSSLLI